MRLKNTDEKDKYIKIYKGKSFVFSPKKNWSNKVIVFDLDETIGSFGDLYTLWGLIEGFFLSEAKSGAKDGLITDSIHGLNSSLFFDKVLDLYPEFFRYGILNILEFLYHKKISGECSQIFIYTNNQCLTDKTVSWVQSICIYISKKIEARVSSDKNKDKNKDKIALFDKIIGAFKIEGKIVEFSRTSNSKNLSDLFKCAVIPKNTEICFIDNTYYSGMLGDRVYYIKPRSYNHSLSHSTIMDRFFYSHVGVSFFIEDLHSRDLFYKELNKCFSQYSYKDCKNEDNIGLIDKIESDLLISQRLMYYLKEFFYLSSRSCKKKTRKFTVKMGKYTRKKRVFNVSS